MFLVTAAFDRMVLGTFLKDTKPELTPGLANLLMGIYGNDISSHETLLNKDFSGLEISVRIAKEYWLCVAL